MKLTVVLDTNQSFDIVLNDNNFVKKYVQELDWCLNNCEINQEEAFSGFRTSQESADRLSSACVIINKYLKNFIDLKNDLLNQPQEYFNYLHQKFEQLSGEFGKPTRLFAIANKELKSAIRDLNFYLHHTELKQPLDNFYISFNKDQYRRLKFDIQDYEYFQFEIEPGSLVLHYSELGKDFYDLYKDGLPLDYQGLKNLHYYSGESSLIFKKYSMIENLDFINWLKQNNINPFNKHLGHGKICLGKVVNLQDSYSKIKTSKKINNIFIKD